MNSVEITNLTVESGDTSTFDIINGPDGKPAVPLQEQWHEGNRFSKGAIVFAVVSLLGLAAGIYVAVVSPKYAAAAVLGFGVVAAIGALLGKAVNARAEQKRTWLESEIELSWFRSLNNMPHDGGNLDWDVWERNVNPDEAHRRIEDYERGFRDGYARGLRDGS